MKDNRLPAKNVLLLCSDCLRADRIYGYHRDLIPNIRKLMNESVHFTRAFSVGPNTPNSYPSIFGHIYPSETSRLGFIPKSVETVAETFARNGYYTYGFNAGNAWISEYWGYDRGFANFQSHLNLSSMPDSRLLSGSRLDFKARLYSSLRSFASLMRSKAASNASVLNALRKIYPRKLMKLYRYVFLSKELYLNKRELEKVFSEEILSQIQGIDKAPFFLWAHYMTTHSPFVPMKQKFSNNHDIRKSNYLRQDDKLVDLYDDCVFTFDHYVGKIVDLLKAKNLFDSTIIIICGDHGDLLGAGHEGRHHPSKLIPELIRIPLIIKFCNSEVSGQVDEMFSVIGLFASIFRYLGLSYKVEKDINSFEVQGNKLTVKNNEFIYLEARGFQDAFAARCRGTGDVSIYGIMNKDCFLRYNSKYGTYEGVKEDGERRKLTDVLSGHIRRNLTSREKYRLRDRICQMRL